MTTTMTSEERDAFLTEVHIGVLSVNNDDRAPLTIPIWYTYNPGKDLWMTTGVNTRKGKLLRKAKRVSFCVQSETPPYRYVSMEGPIIIEDLSVDENREYTRPMAQRYLGAEEGDKYIAAMEDFFARSVPVLVRLQPENWLTFDGRKGQQ